MKKFKIGIIGVGSISNCHIDSYLGNDRAELYAFCDIDEEQLKKQGEKYHVERLYTDLEEFLKLEEMDAVSVCVEFQSCRLHHRGTKGGKACAV